MEWIDYRKSKPDPDTRILMVDAFFNDVRPVTATVDHLGNAYIDELDDRRISSDPPDVPTFWMYVPAPPVET